MYTVAGDGSVYDSSGNIVGYTDPSYGGNQYSSLSDISNFGSTPLDLGAPSSTTGGSSVGENSISLSGWGTLFSNIATSIATDYKAFTGQSQVINPRTGQPYTQAQLNALATQNAALGPVAGLGGYLPIILIGIVVIVLLRK